MSKTRAELWDYFVQNHDLHLLDSELNDIIVATAELLKAEAALTGELVKSKPKVDLGKLIRTRLQTLADDLGTSSPNVIRTGDVQEILRTEAAAIEQVIKECRA